MNKNGFSRCAEAYIARLRKEGRYSTAHVYQCALFSFTGYCGTRTVSFAQISRENLRCYGIHLYENGLRPNTISTYMRMLRSIYNKGVELGYSTYIPRLFRGVYTGVENRQKKALPANELHKLLYDDPNSDVLRKVQSIAALMFQFCGMSFADIAHLEKRALDKDMIHYNRYKTKTPMCVEVLDSARKIMNGLLNHRSLNASGPNYLLDILSGTSGYNEESAYREYQSALRRFNNNLKVLARILHITSPVTSYSLRHSWATIAKYRGVSIEMISELLGHSSIKTTQIYLKGFDLKRRTEVNRMNLNYVRNIGKRVDGTIID